MPTYFEQIAATVKPLTAVLTKKEIKAHYLVFGGPGELPKRKVTPPIDARSEFLANRAMGDWAEQKLAETIRDTGLYKVVPYGNTDNIAAGHADFKKRYLAGVEETRLYGKRPDLLLFSPQQDPPANLTEAPHDKADTWTLRATGAIEVRSSKFEALKYMKIRRADKDIGKAGREAPSFTVKVEDLKIVYRWIERYQLPQLYAQVFFDSIFAINFLKIFQIISTGSGFTIEKPANSQLKATIMIPITSGTQIGSCSELPEFGLAQKVTRLGRHDAYVFPKGGKFSINPERLSNILTPPDLETGSGSIVQETPNTQTGSGGLHLPGF
jgi:hypothetical protein